MRRLLPVLVALVVAASGCGTADEPNSPVTPEATSTAVPTDVKAPFGAGCRTLPQSPSDPSSPQWMQNRPVRDIVTHNPELTQLLDALKRTDLLYAFDDSHDLTMLFPTDAAFGKVAGWRMAYVRTDVPLFRRIVQHHVIPASLDPKQLNLDGPHDTLEGQQLHVYGFGERLGIGKERSHVVCGNIHARNNVTVYLIDRVLAVA